MQGKCFCGNATYKLEGRILNSVNCHCELCRKLNGSAFSTYLIVKHADLTLVTGNIKTAALSERAVKHFCADCGSPLYNLNQKYPGLAMLYLGSVENMDTQPTANIYCESKLSWTDGIAKLAQFDQALHK
ncbi:GFA family protein [Neptunicella marina]|uniref:GFA family protein n=1 Tax=Neptunicella marina TaxID=2125989 RepID=A0A8J6M333_9ALTE|nr:GFA family protein [Neptunicella marina]MBC3767078.1 GFA family protein [Neptunicella marina]